MSIYFQKSVEFCQQHAFITKIIVGVNKWSCNYIIYESRNFDIIYESNAAKQLRFLLWHTATLHLTHSVHENPLQPGILHLVLELHYFSSCAMPSVRISFGWTSFVGPYFFSFYFYFKIVGSSSFIATIPFLVVFLIPMKWSLSYQASEKIIQDTTYVLISIPYLPKKLSR